MWDEYGKILLLKDLPEILKAAPWNYKDDLCMIAAYDLAKATGEEFWLEAVYSSAPYLLSEEGIISNWDKNEYNIDKISFGKSLLILYDLTKEEKYLSAARKLYQQLNTYPRTEEGNFWHKDIYPQQVWLDGLYMGQPFYAAMSVISGEDHWDDIIGQFVSADKLLWDEDKHLYIHACDTSKRMDWADPQTGRSPSFWLRAEGWYLMALCDVYEIAKDKTPEAKELIPLLSKGIRGIMRYKGLSDMFTQIIDMPQVKGNYPETSGSAMVAYALLKGERLGMLMPGAGEMGMSVLRAIEKAYLRKDNGELHLYGICASAGLGPGPDHRTDRTGTVEYYLSEKQIVDNQHGAACLLAYSEQLLRERSDT